MRRRRPCAGRRRGWAERQRVAPSTGRRTRSTSYLGAYLKRQRSRLGSPKAATATAHKLARIVYALMRHGAAYVKQTEQVYAEHTRQRMEKQFHRRAKELGYEVKKIEPVPPTLVT